MIKIVKKIKNIIGFQILKKNPNYDGFFNTVKATGKYIRWRAESVENE